MGLKTNVTDLFKRASRAGREAVNAVADQKRRQLFPVSIFCIRCGAEQKPGLFVGDRKKQMEFRFCCQNPTDEIRYCRGCGRVILLSEHEKEGLAKSFDVKKSWGARINCDSCRDDRGPLGVASCVRELEIAEWRKGSEAAVIFREAAEKVISDDNEPAVRDATHVRLFGS